MQRRRINEMGKLKEEREGKKGNDAFQGVLGNDCHWIKICNDVRNWCKGMPYYLFCQYVFEKL